MAMETILEEESTTMKPELELGLEPPNEEAQEVSFDAALKATSGKDKHDTESDLTEASDRAQQVISDQSTPLKEAPPPSSHSRRQSEHDLLIAPTELEALNDTQYTVMLDAFVEAAAQGKLSREVGDQIVKRFLSVEMSFDTALRDVLGDNMDPLIEIGLRVVFTMIHTKTSELVSDYVPS
ncbi:hypothetical protein BST61_g10051 [Cercospora zeina]